MSHLLFANPVNLLMFLDIIVGTHLFQKFSINLQIYFSFIQSETNLLLDCRFCYFYQSGITLVLMENEESINW